MAADTVLLISNFWLLTYSFALLVIPCFLSVVLTVTVLVALTDNPVKFTVAPSLARVTWSEVNGSVVLLAKWILYLSASNGWKNALEIPVWLVCIVRAPAELVWRGTCLLT